MKNITDEEIEQKANKALDKRMGTICYIKRDNVQIPYTDGYKDGFLAGLKACRPQWHYLTEDPNDLPDTDRNVWVKRESEIECQIDNYYKDDKGWGIMFREGYCTDDVIAWCELPIFDKE